MSGDFSRGPRSNLQIAPSTVSYYTGRLIEQGLLLESEKVNREMGHPPTAFHLNLGGGQFVGVDFEARNIIAIFRLCKDKIKLAIRTSCIFKDLKANAGKSTTMDQLMTRNYRKYIRWQCLLTGLKYQTQAVCVVGNSYNLVIRFAQSRVPARVVVCRHKGQRGGHNRQAENLAIGEPE